MAEREGTMLGSYRLLAPIGSGGFATVYHAIDERLDSDVAIKILAENHALDIDIRERFLNEARALRRVACDAVVPVYDVGENERAQPYIVLAYADRGDLRDRVASRTEAGHSVTAADLLAVAETLAVALSRAHRVGLVHRDVKPTNLLISSTKGEARGRPLGSSSLLAHDERILLGDLGLAKDLAASSGLTVGAGTHGFSAPEQRTGIGTVDARTDVYGASAVLFWMATGSLPTDDAAARTKQLSVAGLPVELTGTIGRGLATDPRDRFTEIDEWITSMSGAERQAPKGSAATTPGTAAGDGRLGSLPSISASSAQAADVDSGTGQANGSNRLGVLVGFALGAVVAAGATYAATREPAPDVAELEDGRSRIVAQSDDVTVAVTGPTDVVVGETVEFEAAATGVQAFRWVTPDGTIVETNPLVLQSPVEGEATVTLLATAADGDVTVIEFPFVSASDR